MIMLAYIETESHIRHVRVDMPRGYVTPPPDSHKGMTLCGRLVQAVATGHSDSRLIDCKLCRTRLRKGQTS